MFRLLKNAKLNRILSLVAVILCTVSLAFNNFYCPDISVVHAEESPAPGDDGTGEEGQGGSGTGEEGQGEDGTGEEGQGDDGTGEEGRGEDGTGEDGQDGDGTDEDGEPEGPSEAEIREAKILENIEKFPESYKASLLALHQAHPNWMFYPYETNLDWQTVIDNEVINRKSLVSSGYYGYHREGYCEPGWYFAAENTVKWYMDPRAWLDEKSMFMFETLSYNSEFHSESGLDAFLAKSFMKSFDSDGNIVYAPNTSKTHAQIFMEVGKKSNVSPFHLASRALQEQGISGSPMVFGNYGGYEGYFNYFNIGATSGSSADKLKQGLGWAKSKGWTNAELSIMGGSSLLSNNYISRGQDTLYLQKFNVTPVGTYGNQYMQNLAAPSSEAISTYNMYAGMGELESEFVFKIPVFKNMPEAATTKPTSSTNIVLTIPSGYVAEIFVDGVPMEGISRNGYYIIDAGNGNAKTLMAYIYTSWGMPAGTKFWTLNYTNYYEVTYQDALENFLIYHGYSIRITGKSGIRCISSVDQNIAAQMKNGGFNGFTISEYGTLIMNAKYLGSYPCNYGSPKVQVAKAYSSDTDIVYKNEDGRTMYTAVLTGIPASDYKTELAFRSYAILNKNGKQFIYYGPITSRSIYELADKYIELGTYPVGSSQYEFLNNIVTTAE